jgi:hypothetical protein
LKARRCAVARRLQPPAQCLIDDLSKGPASALRFRLELGRDVVIEGQRRPHALMLRSRHHDVKAFAPPTRDCPRNPDADFLRALMAKAVRHLSWHFLCAHIIHCS